MFFQNASDRAGAGVSSRGNVVCMRRGAVVAAMTGMWLPSGVQWRTESFGTPGVESRSLDVRFTKSISLPCPVRAPRAQRLVEATAPRPRTAAVSARPTGLRSGRCGPSPNGSPGAVSRDAARSVREERETEDRARFSARETETVSGGRCARLGE